MKLLQRLREWNLRRLAKRKVRIEGQVILTRIQALADHVVVVHARFEAATETTMAEVRQIQNELTILEVRTKEFAAQQDRLQSELDSLRAIQRYTDELLLPAMTAGHSRIIAQLEAETAIEIRKQVAFKG